MICIPIKQQSIKSLVKELKESQRIGDFVEIWFDELKEELTKEILDKIFILNKKPLIYKFQNNTRNLNLLLSTKKLNFIDVDMKTSSKIISEIKKRSPLTKIIISYHNFSLTPETKDLKKILKQIYSLKADVAKIATYAKKESDSFRILSLLSEMSASGKKIICLAMGKKGVLTRICGHLFGNYLMYAPLRNSAKTAEGQLTAKELKKTRNLIS